MHGFEALTLPFSELDNAVAAWTASGDGVGPEWARYRSAVFAPPDWFDWSLEPLSDAYKQQQLRLWSAVAQKGEYSAEYNEQTDEIVQYDAVRSPGFYIRRDPAAVGYAAEQILATGHMLAHCGLKPGDRALEYGAGFGQTALALARLGVRVDTVDISPGFCDAVAAQAAYFGVDLTPHKGEFGFNPRPGEQYQAIIFYESFHHCLEFENVIGSLKAMLSKEGRLILCGEPIVPAGTVSIPYPWGLRMDAANLAVVRLRGWMELGFQREFIFKLFGMHEFAVSEHNLPGFHYANLYLAEPCLPHISVVSIFREYLGRDPEPGALAEYSRFGDIETVRSIVANSPECLSRKT